MHRRRLRTIVGRRAAMVAAFAAAVLLVSSPGDAARIRRAATNADWKRPDRPPGVSCADIARGRITGAGVGPVRLGDRVAGARKTCALRDTAIVLAEGTRERGHAVPGALVLMLSTGTLDTSVVRILVRGAGPRTERGIEVGTSVSELRAAYDSICVLAGEGRALVMTPRLRGVSFAIDRPRPAGVTAGAMLASSNLAPWDSAHVREILIHGKPVVGCHPA